MEDLDLKQMSTMVDIIAEEKGLPRDTVLNIVEQAIAAAWRRDNGDRTMNVRAVLNTTTGEADVYIAREVIEDGLAYTPATEIPLSEASKEHKDAKIGDVVEEKMKVKKSNKDDIRISFSAKYMMEALKSFNSDEININYVGEVKPIILKSEDDETLTQLVLPIRTY